MIKALSFGNYKSFQDKQVVVFDAANSTYVVYGKNSSGKSNLFNVFQYIRQLTCTSALELEELRVHKNIFSNTLTSHIQIIFELEGKEYSYELEISYDEGVVFEELTAEENVLFTLKNNKVTSQYFTQPLLDRISTYDSHLTTVLGILFDKNNNVSLEEMVKVYDFTIIRNFFRFTFQANGQFRSRYVVDSTFCETYFKKILEEVKAIDVGIDDIQVSFNDANMVDLQKVATTTSQKGIQTSPVEADGKINVNKLLTRYAELLRYHTLERLSIDVLHGNKQLRYEFESKGTQLYIDYISTFFYEYQRGSRVFIFDELDASLSSALVMRLIQFFNKNFKDAQLIFTTHNTNLLHNNKELHLTKKNYFIVDKKEYFSETYRLSSFQNLRDDNRNNFEKMYLSGRFGGTHEFKK